MGEGPRSVGWTVAAVVLGSVFTFVLWTVVTGDATTGAGYAGVVFVVLIASAVLESRRRRDAARSARGSQGTERGGGAAKGRSGSKRDRG